MHALEDRLRPYHQPAGVYIARRRKSDAPYLLFLPFVPPPTITRQLTSTRPLSTHIYTYRHICRRHARQGLGSYPFPLLATCATIIIIIIIRASTKKVHITGKAKGTRGNDGRVAGGAAAAITKAVRRQVNWVGGIFFGVS